MKRLIAILLCLLLAGALAACGGDTASTGGSSAGAASGGSSASQPDSQPVDDGPPVTLEVYYWYSGGGIDDLKLVEDAINEHILPLINAQVHLNVINASAYGQQMNLMMASTNEQVDLMSCLTGALPVATLYNQGVLLPLDDLLAEYGQGIVDEMGMDYLNACKFDGGVYAVPTYRDMASDFGIIYAIDDADGYGLDIPETIEYGDLQSILQTVADENPDTFPIFLSSSTSTWPKAYCDDLSDSLGVLMDPLNSTEIVNLFETEEFAEIVRVMRELFNRGLVNVDAATSTTHYSAMYGTQGLFTRFTTGKPGIETQTSRSSGQQMAFAQLNPALATTTSVSSITWTIPRNTVNAEKAMQMLNLMYTDPVVANLLSYGIEGKHYVFVDEEKGIINFPEGVTRENGGYSIQVGYAIGNQLITYIWEGEDTDLWDRTRSFNENTDRSLALGFTFNPEDVQNEMTACNNVLSKYRAGLLTGSVDPDVMLPEFIQALKDSGIDAIIAEKQAQLDAWLAA